MNDMPDIPGERQVTAPPAAPPPPVSAKRRGCFFYGCLTTLVLFAGTVGFSVLMFQSAKRTITPVVEEFLAAAESADDDRAYGLVAEDWRKMTSREDFGRPFEVIREKLGARRSLSLTGINRQLNTSGSFARATYAATYEKGKAILVVTLKKEGGTWRVAGIHYNSPAVLAAMKCSSCGATNTLGAKFCSKCGKEISVPAPPRILN